MTREHQSALLGVSFACDDDDDDDDDDDYGVMTMTRITVIIITSVVLTLNAKCRRDPSRQDIVYWRTGEERTQY